MNRSRANRLRGWVALAAILSLLATLIGLAQAAPPATAAAAAGDRPAVDTDEPIAVRDVQGRTSSARTAVQRTAAARSRALTERTVTWPAARSGIVGTPGHATLALSAVSVTSPTSATGATSNGTARRVDVVDRSTTDRTGIRGVLVKIAPKDGGTLPASSSSTARITVGYGGFGHAYGANWPGRLRLFLYPACLLTSPRIAACQVATPVRATNDLKNKRISAALSGTQLRSTAVVALTAVAASSSGTGDFSATPLSPSASWTAGGSSGDFNWSYGLRAIQGNGGPEPKINLTYSAQSVDGRTAATNNQASQLGEGWDTASSYIERGYVTCKDDGVAGRYDLCWKSDNAHLVLNGQSSELIKRSDGTWRLSSDDGSRVRRLTSTAAGNKDNDKEYWELTTSDGTKYYFGRTAVPDQAGDTQSVWWTPVNGNHSGEPCNSAGSTYATRFCNQAWRWNLDYVVDPHGNAMSLWYAAETNYYAKNLVASPGTPYVRGGRLTRIDYGLRAGSTAAAPFQAVFTGSLRCLAATGCDTYSKAKWPDTPYDQICASTAACTGKFAPTFFTRYRLSKVTTKVRKAAAYTDVESWAFTHEFLNSGDVSDGSLWLKAITHTGHVGGTATDPDITFGAVQLTNRVNTAADGISPLPRYRLRTINSETGALTTVNYSSTQCAATNLPTPDSNTLRCFPQKWTPEGNTSPRTDWFHKYVVTSVSTADSSGLAPAVQTQYAYSADGAWAYNDDKLIPDSYRTWSQWRGYATVTTTRGDPNSAGERPKSTTLYFRGMDGDKQTSGTPRSVQVEASDGSKVDDQRALVGQARETTTYSKAGGTIHAATIYTPWVHVTAGSGLKAAWFVGTATEESRSILANGQWRRRTIDRTFDNDTGQVTRVSDTGDTAVTDDQTCTATQYADTQTTTGAWFIGYPSRVVQSKGLCGTNALSPSDADVLTDVRTRYDNLPQGTAPTRGLATNVERLRDHDNGTPRYQETTATTYDAYGRPTSVTVPSAAGGTRTDTTAYTMSTDGTLASTTQVQDAGTGGKNFTTTTTITPEWAASTKVVDPNNKATEVAYDPLGRVASVWLTNRARTATPSIKYAYTLSKTAATSIKTSTHNTDGTGYIDTYQLYDSLLRPRQTQTPTPTGDRILAGTNYDSRGYEFQTFADVYATGPPSATLAEFQDGAVPALTKNTIDGLGRTTKSTLVTFNTERWSTTASFDGADVTKVTPPNGSPAVTTTTDIRGRKIKSVEHGTPDLTTTYTYDLRDNLRELTSPGGTWTYSYDLRNRLTSSTDPDAGAATKTYTESDAVATTTDARGKTLLTTYDKLDRPLALYASDTVDDSKLLTSWVYDTAAKGHPYSQTRYLGGLSGDAIETRIASYNNRYNPAETRLLLKPAAGSTRFQGLPASMVRTLVYNVDQTLGVDYLPRVTVGAQSILATEALSREYTSLGLLDQIQGNVGIVQDVVHDQLGQPQQVTAGRGSAYQLYLTQTFEDGTNRLSRQLVTSNLSNTVIADTHITYDDAGNPTRVADPANDDTQCYRYDDHRRLADAWTPADGTCATAPADATLGGPAAYRQHWTYTDAGLRKTQATTIPTTPADTGSTTVEDTYDYPRSGDPHQNFATTVARTGDGPDATLSYTPDDAGNTTARPDPAAGTQTLEWDVEGNLAKLTRDDGSGQTATSYVYGVDGTLLLKTTNDQTVLYAGDTEVTYDKTTSVTTAKRTYDTGLGILAVRHGDQPGDLTFQVADPHGTAQISLDATTLAPVHRYQMPYGEARGAAPATWPNERGYLNKPADEDTGLTSIGARDFDPTIGRFLSVDPILDTTSPAQMLGYSYANNNPITYSDPTGLQFMDPQGGGGGRGDDPAKEQREARSSLRDDIILESTTGVSDGWSEAYARRDRIKANIEYLYGPEPKKPSFWDIAGGIAKAVFFDPGACKKASGGCALEIAGIIPIGKILKAWRLGGLFKGGDEVADGARAANTRKLDDVDNLPCNCFVAGTTVHTKDGTKPIEKIRIGDKVWAKNLTTGKNELRTVTGLVSKHTDQVMTITVAGGAKVTVTDEHPFYVTGLGWVMSGDLKVGDPLAQRDGSSTTIAAISVKPADTTVYNFTVDGDHNYYVTDAQLLVHNCRVPNRLPDLDGGSLQDVGGPIWRHGDPSALLGTRSPSELRALASQSDAVKLRDFYQAAADAGRGGTTAPIRVQLAQEIIDAWR